MFKKIIKRFWTKKEIIDFAEKLYPEEKKESGIPVEMNPDILPEFTITKNKWKAKPSESKMKKKSKRLPMKYRVCNVCSEKKRTTTVSRDYVCRDCRPNKPKRRRKN